VLLGGLVALAALGASLVAVETAEPSSRTPTGIVNTTGPPTGWKTIWFNGLTISIPDSWAAVRGGSFDLCGPRTPTMFVWPSSAATPPCAAIPTPALVGEVIVSSTIVLPLPQKDGTYSTAVTTFEDATINHVPVRLRIAYRCFHTSISPRHATDCFTTIVVVPAHRALRISIRVADSVRFPGGAPDRARQIADSLRRAPTITAPPSNVPQP
jgi:hypothetical protein